MSAMDEQPGAEDSSHDGRTEHRHGRWSLRSCGVELSEIALDGVVLIETLRPALRDRDWGTAPARIRQECWQEHGDSLVRTLEVELETAQGNVRATDVLTIGPEELRLRSEVLPHAEIETNRTGLTVMLPRLMAGEDLEVRTPGGERRDARLPVLIAPYQPLFDLRSLQLAHRGERAELVLDGDVFEMEDQRNWCDASFKIYSRPLAAPFPYRLPAGERVVQEVRLRALEPASRATAAPRARASAAEVGTQLRQAPAIRVPRISVGATTAFDAASPAAADLLDGIASLVVEIADGFPLERILASAAREANGLDIDLWIAGDEGTDVAAILEAARAEGLTVRRACLVDAMRHVSTEPLVERLAAAVHGTGTEAILGSRTHVAELNREIHAIPERDAPLAVALTPQVHMRESWHVVESLGALPDVLASVRALRPTARVHVGPVTLRPRLNAVATAPGMIDRADQDGYGAHLTPGSTDPRQHTEWAGAWAACLLAAAAAGGVEHVTIAELAGPRGLVGPDGRLSPMGRVVRQFARSEGEARVLTEVAGPGTALIDLGGVLLASNARQEPWEFAAPGAASRSVRLPGGSVRWIDQDGEARADTLDPPDPHPSLRPSTHLTR